MCSGKHFGNGTIVTQWETWRLQSHKVFRELLYSHVNPGSHIGDIDIFVIIG